VSVSGSGAADAVNAQAPREAPLEALERRVAGVVREYDAQGNHRTGTDVDHASAKWLAARVRALGVTATLEGFAVERVDPVSCCVRIAGRRIEGVPFFDGGFTDGRGVTGALGPLGSAAAIGLATIDTSMAAPSGGPGPLLERIRSSGHAAVVLVTRGKRPGLSLSNATRFGRPAGPPVIQVSDAEGEWLAQCAATDIGAVVVAEIARTPARAYNVTVELAGADAALDPVVISTPRSGWWQCASERGGGIACWLEVLSTLAAAPRSRRCVFVAVTGHELGLLGMRNYLSRRPRLLQRCHRWLHFGANLGAPRQSLRLQASDESIAEWAVPMLESCGVSIGARSIRPPVPRGEASLVQAGGAPYIAPISGSEVFHHASDRWPEAIDTAELARYASAFSALALCLAAR
jgi:hypothetical protein